MAPYNKKGGEEVLGFNLSIPPEVQTVIGMTPGDELSQRIEKTRKSSKKYALKYATLKRLKRGDSTTTAQWKAQIRAQFNQYSRDTVLELSRRVVTREAFIKKLVRSKTGENMDGKINYQKLIEEHDDHVAKDRRARAVIMNSHEFFLASYVDQFRNRDSTRKANLYDIVARFELPHDAALVFKANCDDGAQDSWRKNLLKRYGSVGPYSDWL